MVSKIKRLRNEVRQCEKKYKLGTPELQTCSGAMRDELTKLYTALREKEDEADPEYAAWRTAAEKVKLHG